MPDDQAPLALQQFAERPHQPVMSAGFGGVQHMERAGRVAAPVDSPQQRQLAGSGLALQREPLARGHRPHPPDRTRAATADRSRPGRAGTSAAATLSGASLPASSISFTCTTPPASRRWPCPRSGPAVHPRRGPGGQLDIDGTKMAGGQRLGCMPEQRGLVAGVKHVPGVVVHHHHVVAERKDDPASVPAGPQVVLQQLELPRAAVVEQRLRDLAGGAAGRARSAASRASLRQQVRPTAPMVLPETGWRIGTAAQARSSSCSA